MAKFRFSKKEIGDLLKAWIVLSIAFAVLQVGAKFSLQLVQFFAISAFTVGSGFLLHELAHKYFAQKYGCVAEFRAFPVMLAITLFSSLFGFIFAAPGAVFFSGHNIPKRKIGHISIAGPITNVLLAAAFFLLAFVSSTGTLHLVGTIGMRINAWLALFNMIPFGPFDGKKVWDWNKGIWILFTFVALILVMLF